MAARKLTDAQVAEIRASGETNRALAVRHGVAPGYVWQVKQGEAYAAKRRESNRRWLDKAANRDRHRERCREAMRRSRANPEIRERHREAMRRSRAKMRVASRGTRPRAPRQDKRTYDFQTEKI